VAEAYCPSLLEDLVNALAQTCGKEINQVWYDFGYFAFTSLHKRFTSIYSNPNNPIFSKTVFDFIEKLNVIHLDELRKLYPNARFPRFEIYRNGDQSMTLVYKSTLDLSDLAEGLLQGCVDYFAENITIQVTKLSTLDSKPNTKFTLIRGN
jgi:hypothetical protein